MRKWFVRGLIGTLVAATGALVVVVPALATTTPTAASTSSGSPGQGLEISPPVIELSANPGQTVTVNISVRDVTKGELIAKGQADDFGAGNDEGGQPQLLLNETGATRYSLKYWVANVPDMDLQPQELRTAKIVINVPANAEPGGHYGVIRFTAVPPNLQGTGVALSASVGTLVLMRVNGPVTDNLSMVQFAATQKNVVRSFFESGPVGFLVRVRNEGTVHEQPQGSIVVKNLFGHTVGTVAVNPKGGNVLPDSIRRFTQGLSNEKLFGYYKANVSLKYASTKQLDATLVFWVIPWKLVLLVLVLLVLLFFIVKWGLRKYNEHIIAQARRK